MRWFYIRRANIDDDLRLTFERYGVVSMQVALASENAIYTKEKRVPVNDIIDSILPWLTEQYDRAERRETWSITMEAAITILVAIEVIPLLRQFVTWIAGAF